MNLYKVTIKERWQDFNYFVLATDETKAKEAVFEKRKEWNIGSTSAHLSTITLIAQEDRYGKPDPLILPSKGTKK